MKNKVVINRCWGGFSLSDAAMARLFELESPHVRKVSQEEYDQRIFQSWYILDTYAIPRHDPLLLQVVEELGVEKASGDSAKLDVVEIDGNQYAIKEYDGAESVETPAQKRWVTIEPTGVTIA